MRLVAYVLAAWLSLGASAPAGLSAAPAGDLERLLVGRILWEGYFEEDEAGEWVQFTSGGPEAFCDKGVYSYRPDRAGVIAGRYSLSDGFVCTSLRGRDTCRDAFVDRQGGLWLAPRGVGPAAASLVHPLPASAAQCPA